jgi:hypothetical protein
MQKAPRNDVQRGEKLTFGLGIIWLIGDLRRDGGKLTVASTGSFM